MNLLWLDLDYSFTENRALLVNLGYSLLMLATVILLLWILSYLFQAIYSRIEGLQKAGRIRSVRIRSSEILGAEALASAILTAVRGVRFAITLALIYYSLNIEFILFPGAYTLRLKDLIRGTLLTILTATIAVGISRIFAGLVDILHRNIPMWKGRILYPVRFKTVEILSVDRIAEILEQSLRMIRLGVNILLFYIFLPVVFSFFDFTKTWADILFGYILHPIRVMGSSILNYVPNLFFIAVTILVSRYVVKLTRIIFREIEVGRLEIPGFQKDWAEPTYKIVRFLIFVFVLVVIFPYLPGSQSEAFKGVSIFLGVLLSLGSSSAISNIVAGVILTYMYPFRLGDRVRIGEAEGDVVERTLLVTRIRTIKNAVVTIPNSSVLNSSIINYSALSRNPGGLVLHTTITLGYDVPWRNVNRALMDAADRTTDILKEPMPYVLQTALGDFSVSYELNASTDRPERMARIYSDLHQNIQDCCNESGIEILSPTYQAIRDGNHVTIPSSYLKEDYRTPGFHLEASVRRERRSAHREAKGTRSEGGRKRRASDKG